MKLIGLGLVALFWAVVVAYWIGWNLGYEEGRWRRAFGKAGR